VSINNLHFLIDTNIIIPLEDANRILDERLSEIRRISSEHNVILKIHPRQIEDINRDTDVSRKENVLSRIKQYPNITEPPSWNKEEISELGITESNENDTIDNLLLCAVQKNAVHGLVSEDKKVHSKAKRLGINERVYYIDQFLVFLRATFSKSGQYLPVGIQDILLHQIDKNIGFFDSLRKSYSEFDTWFDKCCRENRKAWIVGETNVPLALIIRKEEENPIINNQNIALPGKALKICTFKVSPEWRGRKIGERLLYTAFKYAKEQDFNWIYLTAFGEEQRMLISLCEEFGFEDKGIDTKGRDHVFSKDMRKPADNITIDNLEYAIKHYPCYKKENCSKWIVPIKPSYHDTLFPDVMKADLFSCLPENYSASSNTIKKAYLCHANTKEIKRGDLLYFYRSGDTHSIQSIGIVEKTFRSNNYDVILAEVAKRTVYSTDEIKSIAQKETLVILFRLLEYIKPVSSNDLTKLGVRGNIQTIRRVNFTL